MRQRLDRIFWNQRFTEGISVVRAKEVVHSPQATHGAVSVGITVFLPEFLVAFSDHTIRRLLLGW